MSNIYLDIIAIAHSLRMGPASAITAEFKRLNNSQDIMNLWRTQTLPPPKSTINQTALDPFSD